ncbi:MAG: BTAD domain-containing putative transcriptional regulator [Acidimicrobiales bacterium]
MVVDGKGVDPGSCKQRALLALLALNPGRVLSADHLIDELWGEHPPGTARHALQVHISNLRKLVGAAPIVTDRPGYVLRVAAESCDAPRFELLAATGRRALRDGHPSDASAALTEALALWRGPALADLLFEPFAAREASRLEELRLAATEDRVVADLELGRHREVIAELEALANEHHHRERLWGLLMLALYRGGRQVEALRAYQTLRDRLRDELGLDPGPELQQLETAILRQEPSLAPPHPAEVSGHRVPERAVSEVSRSPQESRRLATVLSADLVGVDTVAHAVDPEDLRVLLDRYVERSSGVIARYRGMVDNIAGSELIAVFGAPVAHEDDPERAVRAALELRRIVTEHPADFAGLALRIGVETGQVLVAARAPSAAHSSTVVGDVVNDARRLQNRAEPGAVVAGEATHAATRSVVHYRDLGYGAFAALDVAPLKQARPLGLAPLIGRDAEMAMLVGIWRRTLAERRPHLVTLVGEPGVGKSRQAAELERLIAAEARVLRGRCLPYGEALSYAALSEAARQAAGVTAEHPPGVARAKLGELVSAIAPVSGDKDDLGRHLALLTGLDDERDRAAGLVDERTLHGSARRFLEAFGRQTPVCLSLEDLHWADDALLDLVQAIARRARDVPLLILTQARPELLERRPDWGGGLSAFVSLPLQPLDAASTKALVAELGRAHGLAEDVLVHIATQSGGNALFAEELVATVAEGDAGSRVPASLSSLLLARLDALPADQQLVLRLASVIGPSFWLGGVAAMSAGAADADSDGDAVGDLADTLADLEHRDLLRLEPRSSLAGELEYSFKHVLIRDVAYESVPRGRRRELHALAADWLNQAGGERWEEFSDQLAHHALEASQPHRALEYLSVAADRSRRAAAHGREATLLLEAVAVATDLGQKDLVGDLHARRGRALLRLALWAEARAEFDAALSTVPADSPEQLRRRAEVHCDASTACFWLLDTTAMLEHARATLALAEQIGSHELRLAARAQITSADSAAGDVERVLAEGRDLIRDAAALGIDPPFERLGAYSLQLYLTADWEAAIDVSREAVRTGREAGDTHEVLWNLPHIGMSLAASGRYDTAIEVFAEARRFGEDHELVAGLPRCIAMSAGFHLDLFDFAGAEAIQEEARDLGRVYFNPSAVSAGIDLLLNFSRRGDVGLAERLVGEVADEVATGGGWHGWLWQLRFAQAQAEVALARGDRDGAIELARDAIEQSRAKRRAKYEALGHLTLGQAMVGAGMKADGLAELHAAAQIAARISNPAIEVAVAGAHLVVEPYEDVAEWGHRAVERVLTTLSDPTMRRRFLGSDPVRTISSR